MNQLLYYLSVDVTISLRTKIITYLAFSKSTHPELDFLLIFTRIAWKLTKLLTFEVHWISGPTRLILVGLKIARIRQNKTTPPSINSRSAAHIFLRTFLEQELIEGLIIFATFGLICWRYNKRVLLLTQQKQTCI